MPTNLGRRRFLAQASALSAFAGLASGVDASERKPASKKLNLAVIGVAHRGAENLAGVASENIVALCDVDDNNAAPARKQFPKAAFFRDFRKLYDQVGKQLDGVVVSTPDHTHFHAAYLAIQMGKPVYCEKPLCHTVEEVRRLTNAAAEKRVITQMGTQIHAGENYRRVVELIRAGAIGQVHTVQVWLGGRELACKTGPNRQPPATLDWDAWLGPLPSRQFTEVIHPNREYQWPHFNWRWWWEFGGGFFADMACHYIDLPYWALELPPPMRIRATGKKTYEGDNDVPSILKVEYEHAAGPKKPVRLFWYHGVPGPSLDGTVTIPGFQNGVLFEGDKGQLVADYSRHKLLPEEQFKGFKPPPQTIAPSPGHHREWIEAIQGNGQPLCPFRYSGRLTEAVLLGNVAYRCGEELVWNSATGAVTNTDKASPFLATEYRKEWQI